MSRLPNKASDLGIRRLARQLGETAGAIITDHGSLTGLANDDHPQYLNNARGDARYDSLGSATNAVAGHVSAADPHPQYLTPAEASAAYAAASHTHTAAQISDFAAASRAQTEASILAGTNITITPAGTGPTRTLTIAASGGGGSGIINRITTAGDFRRTTQNDLRITA